MMAPTAVSCLPLVVLLQLGVTDGARYVTSNSGGSWLNAAFSFQQKVRHIGWCTLLQKVQTIASKHMTGCSPRHTCVLYVRLWSATSGAAASGITLSSLELPEAVMTSLLYPLVVTRLT